MESFLEYMMVAYFCIAFMSLLKGYPKDLMLILIVLATFVLAPLYAIGVIVDLKYVRLL